MKYMEKCQYCRKSKSNGKCSFNIFTVSAVRREYYCEEAIKKMIEAKEAIRGEK